MSTGETVRVAIEFRSAGETISGSVAVGGARATAFFGWLELIDLLHRAAPQPDQTMNVAQDGR